MSSTKRWTGSFSDFFPMRYPCVPYLVALMIRYDEARLCFGRYQALADDRSDEAYIESFMLVRQTAIAVHDARSSISKLMSDESFKTALMADEHQWPIWQRESRNLHDSDDELNTFRNKISAHIDHELLTEVVGKSGPHMSGSIVLGKTSGSLSFPVAHLALMFAVNDHGEDVLEQEPVDDSSSGFGFAKHVAAVAVATAAMFKIMDCVLCVFHTMHPWETVTDEQTATGHAV